MKTRLAALLTLVLPLSACALANSASTAPSASRACAFHVDTVRQPTGGEITRGTTQLTVRRLMGPALRELSPDVWAYADYHPHGAAGQDHGCDTLLITFTRGQVSDLQVVNRAAAEIIAAHAKPPPPATRMAKQ